MAIGNMSIGYGLVGDYFRDESNSSLTSPARDRPRDIGYIVGGVVIAFAGLASLIKVAVRNNSERLEDLETVNLSGQSRT